ncbi:hypothetical protein [Nonomuraea dietziae]
MRSQRWKDRLAVTGLMPAVLAVLVAAGFLCWFVFLGAMAK